MVIYIARSITDYLLKSEIITKDQKEMCEYGILTLTVNTISILEILFLGLVTNTFVEATTFVISIALLRSFTGGFHFNNYILCNIGFSILYIIIIVAYTNISNTMIINGFCIFGFIIICIMSPVVHVKKRLNEHRQKRNKYIAIILGLMLLTISFTCTNLEILKYTIIATALLQLFTIGGKEYVA